VGQKQNSFISEIIEITEDEFANSDLSVVMLANRLSYNPKYISHIFKEKMGVTYTEYLRNVRIKYAITLFDHGIDSVKNVALLSGFSDPLYFSNVFKKNIGMSPREYIETSKNK
jgi:YesN/AraC family two-component response regulator